MQHAIVVVGGSPPDARVGAGLADAGRPGTGFVVAADSGYDHARRLGLAVDVLVGRVRRKIDADGVPSLLHTMRGVGYVLTERPGGSTHAP